MPPFAVTVLKEVPPETYVKVESPPAVPSADVPPVPPAPITMVVTSLPLTGINAMVVPPAPPPEPSPAGPPPPPAPPAPVRKTSYFFDPAGTVYDVEPSASTKCIVSNPAIPPHVKPPAPFD